MIGMVRKNPVGTESPWRPTCEQLAAARGKTVPDLIAPGLHVLFCGINPGLYSGAVGHHFARPGNRFWPALFWAHPTIWPLSLMQRASLSAPPSVPRSIGSNPRAGSIVRPDDRSPQSGNVITRNDAASISIAGRTYSHRP